MQQAIGAGAGIHPAAEYSADRAVQLFPHILREGLAIGIRDHLLVATDDLLPILGIEVGIEVDVVIELEGLQYLLEFVMFDVQHDIAIHLNEAAIAVIGETRIARTGGEPLHRRVVEAEIEHGIHHARHRHPGARPDRDQQRIGDIAEAGAHCRFQHRHGGVDLRRQTVGEAVGIGIEGGTDLGRDGEAGRHRQTQTRHFGEVGALGAQQAAHVGAALGAVAAEAIDIFTSLHSAPRMRLAGTQTHSLSLRVINSLHFGNE